MRRGSARRVAIFYINANTDAWTRRGDLETIFLYGSSPLNFAVSRLSLSFRNINMICSACKKILFFKEKRKGKKYTNK